VPNVSGREWEYVRECLDTGWVSSVGGFVDRFEREFASAVGVPHAVATASGTAALHVAMVLSGVGPEDEVVLPALTFVAPANAVRYVGAWPVFVDVDARYGQLDPSALQAFLQEDCQGGRDGLYNRHSGRRVRAVLPVDVLGHPADLDPIHELAAEYGLQVVEDATESLGARYRDRPVGGRSRLTAFSFNGNKLLTTGGGGMLVTADAGLARRARYLTTQAKDDAVEFVHGAVGFNYRLTNVQAAIGVAQLERLEGFLAAKRRIAESYAAGLSDLPELIPMDEAPWARSAWWLYTIRCRGGRAMSRGLMAGLEGAGVQARPVWQPLHLSPAHAGAYARPCPVAEAWNAQGLSLPSSTNLSATDQARVIAAVRRVLPR